jgi:allantoinase
MLTDPGRYEYFPLIDRPRICWPNGAHLAFWVAPNIEFYEIDPPEGQGRPLWPRPYPDVLNYSLRDYGNRAGVWRVFEALDRFGVRASVSLNAAMCDHMPDIVAACVQLKWELFGHGIYNTRLISGMTDDEVRRVIRDSVETIKRHGGRDVAGWLAPALSATENFFDLLPEFGVKYTVDMVPDDQPLPIKVRSGRLISIPYSTEINDVRVMGVRGYSAEEWASMIKTCFDQLYREGSDSGMVMCVPLHPFVIGQPHRVDALHDVLRHVTAHDRVWLATAAEIADYYYEHHYDEAVRYRAATRASAR